jgi:hypothetical protein
LSALNIASSFQGTSVTNSRGGTSCGILTAACNCPYAVVGTITEQDQKEQIKGVKMVRY